jgi:hypothetical protein
MLTVETGLTICAGILHDHPQPDGGNRLSLLSPSGRSKRMRNSRNGDRIRSTNNVKEPIKNNKKPA